MLLPVTLPPLLPHLAETRVLHRLAGKTRHLEGLSEVELPHLGALRMVRLPEEHREHRRVGQAGEVGPGLGGG